MTKDLDQKPSPFEAELEALVQEYKDIEEKLQPDKSVYEVTSTKHMAQMQTRCRTVIKRAAGRNSEYYQQVKDILTTTKPTSYISYGNLSGLIGVADALLHDIRSGYLKSFEELVHGELFVDFLEMAQYLLHEGFKDAAAVIAGSTLEAHLRQLCEKVGIPVEKDGKPKKAETINSELYKAKAYKKLDQKNVTAWLDLRNEAAHGHYGEYSKEDVKTLIAGIRYFITKVPA